MSLDWMGAAGVVCLPQQSPAPFVSIPYSSMWGNFGGGIEQTADPSVYKIVEDGRQYRCVLTL